MSRLAVDPSNPNRLQAGLSGKFQDAAFDEAHSSAFSIPNLWVGVLGVGVLGGLAKLVSYLWAGFSRRARPPALEHPRRQAIYDLIRDEPGLSFREIQRRLNLSVGTLQKHINRLKDDGIVMAKPHRNTMRYFDNDELNKSTWKATAPLRDPDAQRLHEWLLAHPGTGQTALAQQTATWGWTLAKTRRRLDLLQEGNLIVVQREKGRVFYRAQTPFHSPEQWVSGDTRATATS
jgi:DNA-binding transcriptional ArsR family regulator